MFAQPNRNVCQGGISTHTVLFHLGKLQAVNRAQMIARTVALKVMFP